MHNGSESGEDLKKKKELSCAEGQHGRSNGVGRMKAAFV